MTLSIMLLWTMSYSQSVALLLNLQRPLWHEGSQGKHVQLFKMRHKVGKGFYSTAPDAPDGQ